MLLVLGRPQDALGELGQPLAQSPRDAEAINDRGVALQALGQAYPARRDLEHALRLDAMIMGIARSALADCRYTPVEQRLLAGGR
jgi:Flp pilus assembly protein TadD